MIFLTGATGNTGSLIAHALVARGETIRCLLHDPRNVCYLPPQAQVVRGDVRDTEALAEAMRGASACLHIAHIRYAHFAIGACRRAGVRRLICLSSTRRFTRFPCETSRAVIEGEAAVESSRLDWTILRPSMIYGGGRDNNIQRMVGWFRRVPVCPLINGGRNLVQPVHARDVTAAVLAALERPQTAGHAYTLAGPEPIPWRALAEGASRLSGRHRVIFFPIPFKMALTGVWFLSKVSSRSRVTPELVWRLQEDKAFAIDEARRELDFAPRSFEEGLGLSARSG